MILKQPNWDEVTGTDQKSLRKKTHRSDPFSIVKNINRKSGLLDYDYIDANYVPYVINMIFGQTKDSVVVAQELNIRHQMTKYEQYRYYYERLPKNTKRFGGKVEVEPPKYTKEVMAYFDFSKEKAYDALTILTDDEIKSIIKFLDIGGVQDDKRRRRPV